MQEFTAAHWLSNNTWTKQCASIRYISHSRDNFSLFRMLVRFLCGILSDRSAAIISIMYRYLTPQPTQLIDMPLTVQFQVRNFLIPNCEIYLVNTISNCLQFYMKLTQITKQFAYYRQFLPDPIYFYLQQTVSPNEWICFLQSLQLLSHIQLIYGIAITHLTSHLLCLIPYLSPLDYSQLASFLSPLRASLRVVFGTIYVYTFRCLLLNYLFTPRFTNKCFLNFQV